MQILFKFFSRMLSEFCSHFWIRGATQRSLRSGVLSDHLSLSLFVIVWSLIYVGAFVLTPPCNPVYAQPSQNVTPWDARLRRWEQLNTITSKALKELFRSGPSQEVLRAVAQRRWTQGLSLSLQAARDRRERVRHMAYFALSQLDNISLQSWMSPLLQSARHRKRDRAYLARILGVGVDPQASHYVAPLIADHESFEVFRAALISAWQWAKRGHLVNLTPEQAKLITAPHLPRTLRRLALEFSVTYLQESISHLNANANTPTIQHLRQHLNQTALGGNLTQALIALKGSDPQAIIREVIKWWGVHQLQDTDTTQPVLGRAQELATRRLASAHIMAQETSAALAPLIFERYLNRLTYRQRGALALSRSRESLISSRRDHSGEALLFNTDFRAHLRLSEELLNLRRPSADLIRVARRGIRMTREWEADLVKLKRDKPDLTPPLNLLGMSEVIRLRCYLSALVDLKSRRVRSLKSCSTQAEWYPLIVKLALKVTLNAPSHHRVKDLQRLFKLAPPSGDRARADLVRALKKVKLLGRRRGQVSDILKNALKLRGTSALAALEVIAHHRLGRLAPEVIKILTPLKMSQAKSHSHIDLTMTRAAIRTLGELGQQEYSSHVKPYLTSPHAPLRTAAHIASSRLGVDAPKSDRPIVYIQRLSTPVDLKWGEPAHATKLIFTFDYGEVQFKLAHRSFHALRSLETLDHHLTQRPHTHFGVVDEAQRDMISLSLPQLREQAKNLQSEPMLTDPSYLVGERWVLIWSGPEWDEIEPRLILTRGPLDSLRDRHGIIGELSRGREVLTRLGVGDQVRKIELR